MGLKCATPACRARGSFQCFVGNCVGQDFFVGLVEVSGGIVHGIASLLGDHSTQRLGGPLPGVKGRDLVPIAEERSLERERRQALTGGFARAALLCGWMFATLPAPIARFWHDRRAD
jgi:hypothetical protein